MAEFVRYWNRRRRRRWPKATLPSDQEEGGLRLESYIPADLEIGLVFLMTWLGAQIGGTLQFADESRVAAGLQARSPAVEETFRESWGRHGTPPRTPGRRIAGRDGLHWLWKLLRTR